MSLKAFHIVFVVVTTLAAFGIAALELGRFFSHREIRHLVLGALSLATGVGLIFYGRYVLKKLKHISYL